MQLSEILSTLGIQNQNPGASTGTSWIPSNGEYFISHTPVDGRELASVQASDRIAYDAVLNQSLAAFEEWRMWPAPKRGEVVRQIGEALRKFKDPLGRLVSCAVSVYALGVPMSGPPRVRSSLSDARCSVPRAVSRQKL